LVGAAPVLLNTLVELSAALNNDATYATTITNALASKAPLASLTFSGTVGGLTRAMVQLGNVDNTSDASTPTTAAVTTAIGLKAPLASPAFTGTVTGINQAMVQHGDVDNTTDALKPVSAATTTQFNLKANSADVS
jgi:hypothetical protein